jgi:hypothetical protein
MPRAYAEYVWKTAPAGSSKKTLTPSRSMLPTFWEP